MCQVQLLTICHYSKFTYIPNTCCSCSSHSVNLLFLGSWKKSTQVTVEYMKIKLFSQTFCSDEGQTLTTSVRNSTWWPIHIINSLSVDKTKLSLSCNNIYEKITHVWLAEYKCIFHVTQVKITNGMCTSKILSLLTFCDAFFMQIINNYQHRERCIGLFTRKVSTRNQTSDLWILHTARISNVDSVMFVDRSNNMISFALQAHAILLSLKNLLLIINTKLHP